MCYTIHVHTLIVKLSINTQYTRIENNSLQWNKLFWDNLTWAFLRTDTTSFATIICSIIAHIFRSLDTQTYPMIGNKLHSTPKYQLIFYHHTFFRWLAVLLIKLRYCISHRYYIAIVSSYNNQNQTHHSSRI